MEPTNFSLIGWNAPTEGSVPSFMKRRSSLHNENHGGRIRCGDEGPREDSRQEVRQLSRQKGVAAPAPGGVTSPHVSLRSRERRQLSRGILCQRVKCRVPRHRAC